MTPVFKPQFKGNDEINLQKIVDIFSRRWYWLIVFLFLGMVFSWLYLRYTNPVYQASCTIKIESDNSAINTLGLLKDIGSYTDNIQTEILIMKSRSMVMEALENMDYPVSYYQVGRLLVTEMYKNSPFKVMILNKDPAMVNTKMTFTLLYEAGNKFELSYQEGEEVISNEYYFGEEIDVKGFRFMIIENAEKGMPLLSGVTYQWRANSVRSLVGRAKGGLEVTQMGYMVSVLKLTSKDNVPGFAADFVNSLAEVYYTRDTIKKTQAATQAISFIDEQIHFLQDSVSKLGADLQKLKENKNFTQLEQMASSTYSKLAELERHRTELDISGLEIRRLRQQVTGDSLVAILPLSLGTGSGGVLQTMVESYNELNAERISLLGKYPPGSAVLSENEEKIRNLKNGIQSQVEILQANNDSTLRYLDKLIRVEESKLGDIPSTERTFADKLRNYQVVEEVLNTLLEKRAEAQIAKASIVSSVEIMDLAYVPSRPISPNKPRIFIMGIGIGLSGGVLLILVLGLLKNTISYKEEVENLTLTPIIGVVRRSPSSLKNKYPRLQIIDSPKSSLSESIRAIRTNLQFISADKKSKTISITSTISGEGKSFIIINLGGIISMLNRKVVILDMDLRKPKLHHSFGLDNSKGISTFLVGKSELSDVLCKTEYENLDVIPSGPIPPNPAELIQSFRMELLLLELKKNYDFILIDTPPIGLVTDGASLLKQSDISLYVIRADYSKKAFASIPDQLVEDHKVKNLYIVLNSVATAGGKYGYGAYGYTSKGYYTDDVEQAPWWKFWTKFKR